MGQQHHEVGFVQVVLQRHRCAEATQDRRHGLCVVGQPFEVKALLGTREHQQFALAQHMAVSIHQCALHRDDKRQFLGLAGRGWAALAQGQGVATTGRIEVPLGLHMGCTGLRVPEFELGQVFGQRRVGRSVGNGLGEVVAGHRLTIVTVKVELHAACKPFACRRRRAVSYQGLHHAHHFRPFFVDGDGVEVVDLDVAVRPHRVGHRTRVFGELHRAQQAHVFNALDGARAVVAGHVLAELLVAKNGQTLFE